MKKAFLVFGFIFVSISLYAQFLNSKDIPEVQVQLISFPKQIESGKSFTVSLSFEIPKGYHMFLNEDLFNIFIENDYIQQNTTEYPLKQSEELFGKKAFSGIVTISRNFTLSGDFTGKKLPIQVVGAYQICENDGTCLLPEKKEFNLEPDIITSQSALFPPVLLYVLLAFIGGIVLNVMPCVLPLLSVKALNLVQQSDQDRKVIFRSSLLYGIGIWFSFLALAGIVIALKSSGELFGWGFQFQNPVFVFSLLSVIFIFSLSLFDVFTINPPSRGMTKASKYSAGKSYGSSFFTGIFAVLVATPCTAPFMGAALGFAFSQTAPIIILIFSFLSFGFAFPFILLGLFPALIKKIPKPGNWMNTFKEFMGFLLLGTVVYLMTTLHSLIGSSIKGVFWFLLLTGFAVWFFGKFGSIIEKPVKRVTTVLIALFIISASAFLFVDLHPQYTENSILKNNYWQIFSTKAVEKSRNEGKPVFIDFYADWCTSCKVNDISVLNRDETRALFEQYDVVPYKGDFTSGNEEIARWLSEYGRAGVPLYLLFRPGEEAVEFPEFLTYKMLKEELEKIRP